jgi:hypothetical protein
MSGKPVRLDGQVAVKIAICLAALGVFFWLLVQPKMAEVTRLDAEIVEAREVISRQGKLFPLYAAIYADLAQADLTPFPELRGGLLGLEDIPRIPDLMGSLARAHGLEVRSVTRLPSRWTWRRAPCAPSACCWATWTACAASWPSSAGWSGCRACRPCASRIPAAGPWPP